MLSCLQEVHTPEPSAGKLWIGGSGMTATHALLMAKLIVAGKDYGMHPFLMPLRDPDSHRLLPGRSAIDMGPKKGAPSMDNGYLTFDHVRIPRTNLLARFQTVDEHGNYKVQNQQGKLLIRGTMTLVRVGLCEIAAHHAARATLIAIRYALVRRQGSAKEAGIGDALERQIIDYPGVQQRLFTAIASSYALTFAARQMRSIYNQLQSELHQSGKSDLLGIVHGYTSVLKAVMTNEGYGVVWRCRKSMGGLGFSAASGLTDLENSQPDANLTYEGDNNMLLGGPAANFLVKQLRVALETDGKPGRPELAYLASRPAIGERYSAGEAGLLAADQQLAIVGRRAARLVYALHDLRSEKVTGPAAACQSHLDARLAARASRAHGTYFILFAFNRAIEGLRSAVQQGCAQAVIGAALDRKGLEALERVRSLYALEVCILDDLADYAEDGFLTTDTIDVIRRHSASLMAQIRPDALGLVEAADMDDWYLASPLGCSDGRAYERMVEFMHREPLNQSGPHGGREQDGVLKGFRTTMGRLTHGEVQGWNEEEAQKREAERQKERTAKL